jgi:nucleoside-triphosphatase THEP1
MKRIVLISGKQGSGKTTLSKNLTELFTKQGLTVANIKFADVLYELHDTIWGVMNKYGRTLAAKKDGPLLQLLGTEWGRNTLSQNVWVEIAQFRAAQAFKDPNTVVIVDDCRFPNELESFDSALKVRLEAPSDVRKLRCEAWRDNGHHQSETALDDVPGFDLYYRTDSVSSLDIAKDIRQQLELLG